MTFSRIAIVNRGEPAVRLIHAVAELKREGWGLTTIALCTEAERRAMFVREADEAAVISSPSGIAYLDYGELERAMVGSGADAAWVGWGFVAEHPEFADLCDRLGVTFIGPSGDVMRRLGDKIGAKHLAEQVGAPVAAWSGGPVDDLDAARRHAEAIGFPLLIKAAAGGGGRGIRFVDGIDGLADAFERARVEAERAFGDPTVFMERRLTGARHIEVQVAADVAGTVWALGVRDCSIQRRNQKVLEESSSPVLTDAASAGIARAAVDLVAAADYRNVGTVEFLYRPEDGTVAFLEVNTRLQVEHPVTEMTTGVDLVKLQLRLAAGALLEGDPPPVFGHAIEARLNAEDPQQAFASAPGTIDHLEFAHGPGVRVDTGVAAGDVIPADYDAMVAKIIAWGRTREEARVRLMRALEQTAVTVRGGTTNKSFLLDVLDREEFVSGTADTTWLDRLTAAREHITARHGEAAVVMAAIEAWAEEMALERTTFYAWATRGRPQTDPSARRRIDCRFQGQAYELTVGAISPDRYRVVVDGVELEADVEYLRSIDRRLTAGGRTYRIRSTIDGMEHLVEVDGVAHRVSRDSGGVVRAPAPALVVSVAVAPGAQVEKGQVLAVLESMKMENPVLSPVSGRVRAVHVAANTQVDAGAALLQLEPDEDVDRRDESSERLDFSVLTTPAADDDARARCLAALDAMRWQVLGFDADDSGTTLDSYRKSRADVDPSDPDVVRAELAVLEAFADVSALSRNRPEDEPGADELRSPEQYFHRYLRVLDVDAEDLPESFRLKLQRAVRHFGIADLERSGALERAAHDIFRAQHLAAEHRQVVVAILGQRPPQLADLDDVLRDRVRSVLDLVIAATQVRHPVVGDLARSVRFRIFDEPSIEANRAEVTAVMRARLDDLAAGRGDRAAHLEALVHSPYLLLALLTDYEDGVDVARFEPLLEAFTRRNYQIREIEQIRLVPHGARPVLVARYRRPGDNERLHTVATVARAGELREALRAVAIHASSLPSGGRIVADIYAALDPQCTDAQVLADRLSTAITSVDLPDAVDRVAVSAQTADGQPSHVTFRRQAHGRWTEDRSFRGLHPMIAVRLGLWRLREHFDIERLPSVPDTYLFRAVARTNPRDERIIAAAEVRDLALARDEVGRLTGLPGLENVYASCIDGLRRAQAERPENRRLFWNRIMIYVWESVDFGLEEADLVVRSLEPLGRGLGIEEVDIHVKLGFGAGTYSDTMVRIAPQPGGRARLRVTPVPTEGLRPANDYELKVVASRQRGAVFPYELIGAVTGAAGSFVEHDLADDGRLVPVEREPGTNSAGLVTGIVSTPTASHPEGMRRVILIGDPTRSLGSLAEAESRIVIGALDLAEREQLPVEWFALSSGARIAMDTGTENMDWVAAALRRIVRFTQTGGEINVVVTGINVGAQPYWNAEATMLQHTSGILVMTPESTMVLTGKHALDISGGVSAEDNFGIGGYDRIMGPNGQAQYWAADLSGACDVLFAHYLHAYRAPGERFPRRVVTEDPADRDVRPFPHAAPGCDFATVGDIFSNDTNPGRKKPFDIRTVMRAVADQDHVPLERWAMMQDADTAVVLDVVLGGIPVTMIGVESRPLGRIGALPADGPDQWSAGTLFPLSSKKVARGINAASGNRPAVILANLSGFDGSPESLRRLQLEYGAEIGRAIVNFDGPIVFCVVSRYHGGAFVVFSRTLNDNLQVLAVEGTYASVLGGAPAAAVVFAGDVNKRVAADARVREVEAALNAAPQHERLEIQAQRAAVEDEVRSEKLGEIAAEFDAVHSIERARAVGSVHEIVPAAELRPRLIAAVERGMARALDG